MNIEQVSIKKLVEINNTLNVIEVRGLINLHNLSQSILAIQEVLQEIDKVNKGITIDNTKEVK